MHKIFTLIKTLLGARAEARRAELRCTAYRLLAADRAARREGGAA